MLKIQSEQNLFEQLNDNQRQAVVYCDGPQLVIAGAGSGKTRVLTYKITYLLVHHNLQPWNVLALTFTNKAANEMKERIAGIVGLEQARSLQMGTFHSIFSRILRMEAAMLGFTSDFTIYDESDSRSLIKSVCKTMGIDDKTYKPSSVHAAISMAKNRLQLPDDYANDSTARERDRRRNMPETYKVYMAYQARLRQANAMDFDDLLVYTFQLLRQNEEIRRKYASRFRYVLVDEYQDTNYVQQQILWLLTSEARCICVVGDDYQSIYAFRGANIANILNFQKVYSDARLFKLERNYRSTKLIVSAANSLMKHNERQIPKDVYSENEDGEKVKVLETISDKREASIVCREIKRIHQQEHCRWSDFAILYRTNSQSRLFEEEMRKPEVALGDHYRVYGGLSFYQRKEIKDLIAYFRLVVNPDDEEAFRRIVNYPARGIGDTTLAKVMACAQEAGASLWMVISEPLHYGLSVNRGTAGKLQGFRALIDTFVAERENTDALSLAQSIIEKSGVKADLAADRTAEGDSRRENVDSLISGIADFVQAQREDGHEDHVLLTDYLANVSLMTDLDSDDTSDDKISLMTIHSAKGLEFGTVFVVGLEENIFPGQMSVGSSEDLEEERRLLYVAITRAEKHCYLTWAHTRWRFGKMDGFVNSSRFLNDIDPKYLDVQVEGGRGGSYTSYGASYNGDRRGARRPWEDDYEIDRPYTGSRVWGNEYPQMSSRMQNSRPVAGQFMADPKPKITAPHRPEQAVNPFSPSFEKKLRESGNWRKVEQALSNGGRTSATGGNGQMTPVASSSGSVSHMAGLQSYDELHEGSVVEHMRFGRGVVFKVEGVGENAKATVDFDATGRKQLLLKFAKLRVVG